MDPQIPTSFIPKRPITSEATLPEHRSHAVGLLSLITAIIAIATIISFAGVYLYEKTLTSQKAKLEQSINDARNGIGTEFLTDMKRLNARITGVKSLLQSHVVVSPIFAALEATTLRSIQYKKFSYEFRMDSGTKTQMVRVQLDGTGKNYGTIALQSDAFAQSTVIRNPVFSNLTIDDKSGTVGFQLVFDVDPADLSFQKFIDAKVKEEGTQFQLPPETAPVTPTTTP